MLNPFPFLLSFGFIAPLLLRAIVSAYFLTRVWNILITRRKTRLNKIGVTLAITEAIGTIALIIGFYTQIAVLILMATTGVKLVLEKKAGKLSRPKIDFYILLFAVLISLLLTGADLFAIDLPL